MLVQTLLRGDLGIGGLEIPPKREQISEGDQQETQPDKLEETSRVHGLLSWS